MQGFELCRRYRLKLDAVDQAELADIEKLYIEWEKKILFKDSGLYPTRLDEIYAWEDWFIENYDRMPTTRNWKARTSDKEFNRKQAKASTEKEIAALF